MADQREGGISWTPVVDRGGRRVRMYSRKTEGPTKQARLKAAAIGLGWCRECKDWSESVRLGLCRPHRNEDYNRRYRGQLGERIRQRVHGRRWTKKALPAEAAEMIMEVFGGRCAYCPAPATSFDHLVPVAKGGQTEPGNMVPACKSCNSRKRARDPFEFINAQPIEGINPKLLDRIILAELAGVFSA